MLPKADKEPLVSIVITSFNRAGFIETAIRSALEQDYPNFEVVVSDNQSTDATHTILKKYDHDERIRYFINEANLGMIRNFKLATEQRAKGKFITYISADDYLCNPNFVSGAIDLIRQYPDVVLVAAKNATLFEERHSVSVDDTGNYFEQGFVKGIEAFMKFPKNFLPGWGGALMDRVKLIETGTFESRAQSLDYEANLKLMLLGNVALMTIPSYVFRRHGSQASGNMSMQVLKDNLDFIENTFRFAQKHAPGIDLPKWRRNVYYAYLNGVARRMINRKDDLVNFMNFVESEKKIRISLFKAPKHYLLLKIYMNFDKIDFLLKRVRPGLYRSIKYDK